MSKQIKDRAALVAVAIVGCVVAVLFWRYLGEFGFSVLAAIAVVALWVDNVRLRRNVGRN